MLTPISRFTSPQAVIESGVPRRSANRHERGRQGRQDCRRERRAKVHDREVETLLGKGRDRIDGGLDVERIERNVRGEKNLARVASKVRAVRVQDVALVSELLRRAPTEIPVLREAGGCAQRPFIAAATDTDRRMRLLRPFRLVTGADELVVGCVEVSGLAGQQADEDLASFLEAIAALTQAAELYAQPSRQGPDESLWIG